MKTCSKCGEDKDTDGFHRNKSRADGRHHACKKCELLRGRETRVCQNRKCGKTFLAWRIVGNSRGMYCGCKCANLFKPKKANGPDSPLWRGGRFKTTKGYVMIYSPDHPRAHNKYVLEHIPVAEKKIGRPLGRDEVAHHVNRIRHDNRTENINIMTVSAHSRLHAFDRHRKSGE